MAIQYTLPASQPLIAALHALETWVGGIDNDTDAIAVQKAVWSYIVGRTTAPGSYAVGHALYNAFLIHAIPGEVPAECASRDSISATAMALARISNKTAVDDKLNRIISAEQARLADLVRLTVPEPIRQGVSRAI